MDNPSPHSTGLPLRQAMTRRLLRRAVAHGEITLPAVPGMLDEYVQTCDELFTSLGVRFTGEELAHLRTVIESQVALACGSDGELSRNSHVVHPRRRLRQLGGHS
jgi:hypothetical protein